MKTTTLHTSSRVPNHFKPTRHAFAPAFALLTFGLILTAVQMRGWWGSQAAAGTIQGVVFQDYNANGKRDVSAGANNAAVDRGWPE